MSWFNKIKETASDIADSVTEEFSGSSEEKEEAPRQEVETAPSGLPQPEGPQDDGPSGVVHKGMEKAASGILGASKKTVDLVVKRVRPALQLDAFKEPDDIRHLFEVADEAKLTPLDLIVIGCNSTETVGLARQKYDQIVQDLAEQLDQYRELKDEDYEEMIELLEKEHTEWSSGDHPVGRLVAAVVAAATGNTDTCASLALRAAAEDPNFNNPVLSSMLTAPGVLENLDEDDQRAWLMRALYYRPLDGSLLTSLMERSPQAERGIFVGMLELAM